jgi:hypothetical protein
MFTFDTTIDAVQTGKKQFVKTFISDEKIADALRWALSGFFEV